MIDVPEQRDEFKALLQRYAGTEVEIKIYKSEPDHIDTIEKIVSWYQRIKKGYNDIDTLIDCRKNLASALYSLSKDVTDAHRAFKDLEAQRKRGVEKRKKELIDSQIKKGEKVNVSFAEVTAQDEFSDIRLEENQYEALYKQMQLHYNSTKSILDSFVQHIAHLRGEKNNEMQGKGSQSA
jgi:hypothetical protein